MKTHYLKNVKKHPFTDIYIMITDKKNVEVSYTMIRVEKSNENIEFEIGWHKKHLDMVDCSKEEFDKFYIEIAQDLNKVIQNVSELTTIEK